MASHGHSGDACAAKVRDPRWLLLSERRSARELAARAQLHRTLLHELGHAMGLNHPVAEPPAPDPHNEIMDPAGPDPFTTYQAGDLCGLFELTWQQPCAGAPGLTLGQGQVAGSSALARVR